MQINSLIGGPDITLNLDDKEELERQKRIECRQERFPPIVIHIRKTVPPYWRECLEEPGFHITCTPRGTLPDERTRYDIHLSQQRFQQLTNPEEDPITHGGYFVSRCRFDRCEIKYFALRPDPELVRKYSKQINQKPKS